MATTAETTVYAFLDDSAVHRKLQGAHTYADEQQGVCCIDDQMVNYFMNPCSIKDVRQLRTRPIGLESYADTLTGNIGTPNGAMTLHFDGDKIGSADLSGSVLTTSELTNLFNIIEYAAYHQNEAGVLPTAAAINATLVADQASFGAYQAGTLKVSAVPVDTDNDVRVKTSLTAANIATYYGKRYVYNGNIVELTASNRDTYINTTGYIITTSRINMYLNGIENPVTPVFRTWIEFEMSLSGNQFLCFKIFLDRASFMTNYPFSTITNIIYPCDPTILRALANVDNVADLLSQSSNYTNNTLIPPVTNSDHSGVSSFRCEYVNAVIGNGQTSYNLYFGAMYKGVEPESEAVRITIKNDLLAKTGTTEADWMDILPGLFAQAAFMLVPLWHHYESNASNARVRSCVYNVKNLSTIASTLYPNYLIADIQTYLEVMENAVSDVLILGLPSLENATNYRSIHNLHPTYMALPTSSADVDNQDASTIDFAEQLNNMIGQLNSFVPTTAQPQPAGARLYNGVYAVPFTVDGVTFHVVTKQAYPSSVSNLM